MSARQKPPLPGVSYETLPGQKLYERRSTFRAHHVLRDAWWFDNSEAGRFNLKGELGTCCTALKLETAVREKLRDEIVGSRVVTQKLADSFRVSRLQIAREYNCANVSHDRSVNFGIVRELVTMHDYEISQEWARELHKQGFAGIFYASAYTSGAPGAFALFGDKGAPDIPEHKTTEHCSGRKACEMLGLTVEGPPFYEEVEILD